MSTSGTRKLKTKLKKRPRVKLKPKLPKKAPKPEEMEDVGSDEANRENLLHLKNSYGEFFMPICSIIPYIYKEAADLHKKNNLIQYKKIMNLIDDGVPRAKWTVNLLCDYRNGNMADVKKSEGKNYKTDNQKQIYVVGKDYTEEFQQAVENIEDTDLSHIKNTLEHIGANDKDMEFVLWQHIFKIKKIVQTISEDKKGRLEGLTDLALDSAYRISRKLKTYTKKYGTKILKGRPFGGR